MLNLYRGSITFLSFKKKKKKNIMYLAALDLSCGTGDLLCCRTQNLELWHADSSLQHV